ncbi:Eco57I restriction-modification methylase domain-containing protein [Thermodesulfobacterium thermophilum]|uniref:Eco57I restriction-modification methylase domain-containing protein n=1 Tax=Thermodesulfobacterium thermophilum TaxID=886 RepID=UPI001B7F8162|nr:Eco57I restriction-modification methylase domain-containing protein [Thermodesulfobacterium thermophilum]
MQRNFIAWYLKGSRGGKLKDAALVAFVSPTSEDWRFSLVKMDYRFEEKKVKEEFTPARRWSFLVGKNEKSHTAQSRFLRILENDDRKPTLEDLENAFNIEIITEDFFKKYRDLFIRTKLELDKVLQKDPLVKREFTSKNINTVDFAKKLLGQIVFLYFLQKKGWFGVERGKPWGTGPKDFIRRLFNKEFGDYKNFFNDILEPLFYEALRTDRSSDDHYYSRFNCKIPFLNGGLFDPINGYDWVNVDILLPNELFSNTNRTKEGDVGDGILDVLDKYNFTVNEEEPLEKEVALDPELLGKIYEKLNAIRPDNFEEYLKVLNSGRKVEETKFNKEYGVYYTPREIVHYMCQQSLIYYLETELAGKVSREDIETFVKHADLVLENEVRVVEKGKETDRYSYKIPDSIRQNAEVIDKLLADIKVCDPAVGSGAFPIGLLHEIVKLRQLLSVYLGRNTSTYDLKRHTIENSLYGVDIDLGAIETCKLRFWLSMIVDEDDFYNIKPLPNLDYKVVCGNSLLGFPENWRSDIATKIEELENQYFNETNPTKKNQIKKELDDLISRRLENSERNFGYKINFDFRLFFPQVFYEKGGFDIVIGNPPYVRQERIKHLKPPLQKAGYEVYHSTADLYTYFYEKAWKIARNNGFVCFITSNKWMRAKYGEKLRRFLKRKAEIYQIIDFSGYRVFEQTVDTNIILFKKTDGQNTPERNIKFVNVNSSISDKDLISYIENSGSTIPQKKLDDRCWTLADEEVLRLKEKIERIGKPLKEWDVKIYFGIKTGFNDAFIITSEKREEILRNCRTEEERKRTEEIIKPVLRGRDIGRYYYRWAGLWLIKIESGWTNKNRGSKDPEEFFKEYFPAIYSHLKSFADVPVEGKRKGLISRDDQGDYWWELRDCVYYPEFEKEKIVWQEIVYEPSFAYDDKKFYCEATSFIMTGKNLKYILAILNSKPGAFFFRQFYAGGGLGEKGYRYKKAFLEKLPIPPIIPQNQHIARQIESLVDQILSLTQSEDYLQNPQKQAKVKEYDLQIDELVYKLYDLSRKEIEII